MVPSTRRRLLQGAAALAVGLAGCNATSSSTSSTNDPRDAENVETDPEGYALRNPADAPVAWFDSGETETTRSGSAPRFSEREAGLIASTEEAGRLRFADVEGADEARSFVEATDFDAETVLVEPRRIEECYRLELCAVTWSATSYHTYFGRTLRPADVACDADAHDRVSQLVRIPAPIDPDEVTSHGSGGTSGSCWKFHRRFRDSVGDDGNSSGGGGG